MVKAIFIVLMGILALYDSKRMIIPNIIVLPAIAIGIYLTGNWQAALLIFMVGVFMYNFNNSKNLWAGGDVKLMTMIGAFLGFYVIPIIALTFGFIKIYRWRMKIVTPIAVAPLSFFVSLLFLL